MTAPLGLVRALPTFVRLVWKPEDLDSVLKLVDSLEVPNAAEQLFSDHRRPLDEAHLRQTQPRLGEIDRDALRALPEGTLGRAYADFLDSHGFSPDDIPAEPTTSIDTWATNHLRESHDLWHVATGFGTDVAGELGLQAFYLAQLSAPIPAVILIGGLMNSLRDPAETWRRMDAIAAGWQAGKAADALFGVEWSARWAQPLAELRQELKIDADCC